MWCTHLLRLRRHCMAAWLHGGWEMQRRTDNEVFTSPSLQSYRSSLLPCLPAFVPSCPPASFFPCLSASTTNDANEHKDAEHAEHAEHAETQSTSTDITTTYLNKFSRLEIAERLREDRCGDPCPPHLHASNVVI
jgi:hypothetical protein